MSESSRFKTQGKVEALLYRGSFPLDFLRGGETVGVQPGRGMDGSCQIDTGDDVVRVELGELIVRNLDGSLNVLSEVPSDSEEAR